MGRAGLCEVFFLYVKNNSFPSEKSNGYLRFLGKSLSCSFRMIERTVSELFFSLYSFFISSNIETKSGSSLAFTSNFSSPETRLHGTPHQASLFNNLGLV